MGGVEALINLFNYSHELLQGKSADALNKFEKNFMEFMLKITKTLIMAAFADEKKGNLNDFLNLVKKNSSVKFEEGEKDEA